LVDSLKKLGFDVAAPKIIARTGWRTDNLAAAIVANGDTSIYDFVFLLIGVNNFYQGRTSAEYAPQFEALLTTALGFAGNVNSHVFVLSIPDYGYTPFGQSQQATISAGIDIFNQINKGISLYKQVNYIDITDISRASDGGLVANDGLHPSAYQYKKWVERIIPIIEARMRD
jgi:lysophospholipase L1-like esterase